MNDTEKSEDTQLATRGPDTLTLDAMNPADLVRQVQLIQEVMKTVMHKDEHYGVIPGTGSKPSLLKPGAEKLGFVFRLAPKFEIIERNLNGEHREYQVTCNLQQIHTERFFGSGVGSCSTMEGKYRYRAEVLEGPDGNPVTVPGAYWDSRDPKLLGGAQFSTKKVDSKWVIAHKVEHPNPADYYNTVLKMAKKRAHVDAILTATAASDIFTQDVEDMPEVIKQPEKNVTPVRSAPAWDQIPVAKPAEGQVKLQCVVEGARSTPAAEDDKDQRNWFNAESKDRHFWTRKADIGQMLLDANGLEVVLTLVQGKKNPKNYQVVDVDIPDDLQGLKDEPK